MGSYRRSVEESIPRLDSEQYNIMVSKSSALTLDEMSEKIFLIKRADSSVINYSIKVESVQSRIVWQFMTAATQKMTWAYRLIHLKILFWLKYGCLSTKDLRGIQLVLIN